MIDKTEFDQTNDTSPENPKRRVGLFVTCIVDIYRPTVGFAALKLLEQANCDVFVPQSQTCCGQPAYNAGDEISAKDIAKKVIEEFEVFDYVVAPSGSCAGMLRHHFPRLLKSDQVWKSRAQDLATKSFELTSFLTDICEMTSVEAAWQGKVAYHDSCSSLREMQVHAQPRQLLSSIEGLNLVELQDPEACCGFGGLFSVKYGDISAKIVSRKTADIATTKADMVVGGDLGCLLNIAGRLSREGQDIEVRHIAELLANMADASPIAGSKT